MNAADLARLQKQMMMTSDAQNGPPYVGRSQQWIKRTATKVKAESDFANYGILETDDEEGQLRKLDHKVSDFIYLTLV